MAGIGELDITLDGKPATLRCSLEAAKRVNGFGGFAEALRRLAISDFDTYVGVIAAGLGKKAHEVEDAVYRTGIPALSEHVANFVLLLTNGGNPMKSQESVSGEG